MRGEGQLTIAIVSCDYFHSLAKHLEDPSSKFHVQDAYSLRCTPQVHGVAIDTIKFVEGIITTEMNSALDNPVSFIYNIMHDLCSGPNTHTHTPIITPRTCASKGYVIGRGVHILYIVWTFFWNQSFISKNTHFEMSILTQIGFSSNLMASGTVQQLDKSSWPSQIPIVCRLGKGSPTPETHIAPNHTPTIADFVPKCLNTPTLLALASRAFGYC